MILAGCLDLSASVTVIFWALRMTWAFVMMYPSRCTRKPLPRLWTGTWRRNGLGKMSSKMSRPNIPHRVVTSFSLEMFTTAGPALR